MYIHTTQNHGLVQIVLTQKRVERLFCLAGEGAAAQDALAAFKMDVFETFFATCEQSQECLATSAQNHELLQAPYTVGAPVLNCP